MSFDSRQLKKWPKIIMKKYLSAKESTDFKIMPIDEEKMDSYYILIQPSGGHYKGQLHILEFKARWGDCNLFPFNPPLVKFVTKIFHPNISVNGSVCVDILQDKSKWSPQYDINSVVSSIILLLDTPNNSSPYNHEASGLYRTCESEYKTLSKNIKADYRILDEIRNNCFKSFDLHASNYSNTDISMYMKYFEEDRIIGDITDDVKKIQI